VEAGAGVPQVPVAASRKLPEISNWHLKAQRIYS